MRISRLLFNAITMTKRPAPTPIGLKIVTGAEVDKILSTLDPETALQSQAAVFTAYSAQHSASTTISTPNAKFNDGPPAIQAPQRIVLSTPDQTMLFMPSRAATAGGTAVKIVSVPSGGGDEGLPGTTLVMDEQTGRVKGVVNARKLTALRNACGSALSYRILHPTATPTNLVVFGTGAQADAHARLFIRLWPSISRVTFVGRRPTPRSSSLLISITHAFPDVSFDYRISTLGQSSAPSSSSSAHPELELDPETIRSANIIITCTPSTEALFASAQVSAGTHLALIGSYKPHMREIDDELVRRAGIVLVDSKEACAAEAGELIQGGIKEESLRELGQVLQDKDAAEEIRKSGDVTVFKSVGIGIQDVAVAALVLQEADKTGLGTVISDYE